MKSTSKNIASCDYKIPFCDYKIPFCDYKAIFAFDLMMMATIEKRLKLSQYGKRWRSFSKHFGRFVCLWNITEHKRMFFFFYLNPVKY